MKTRLKKVRDREHMTFLSFLQTAFFYFLSFTSFLYFLFIPFHSFFYFTFFSFYFQVLLYFPSLMYFSFQVLCTLLSKSYFTFLLLLYFQNFFPFWIQSDLTQPNLILFFQSFLFLLSLQDVDKP